MRGKQKQQECANSNMQMWGCFRVLCFRVFHTLSPNSNYCLTSPWLTLPVEHVNAFDGSAQLEGWQLYAVSHLAAAL
mgnify:FL=1